MFLLLLLFIGIKDVAIRCDRVVYEHYYNTNNEELKLSYRELIFYEKDLVSGKFIVNNWILIEDTVDKKRSIEYIYSKVGDYHFFNIYDYEKKKYIKIKTKLYQEITTIGPRDLEQQNRELLKEEYRRRLW